MKKNGRLDDNIYCREMQVSDGGGIGEGEKTAAKKRIGSATPSSIKSKKIGVKKQVGSELKSETKRDKEPIQKTVTKGVKSESKKTAKRSSVSTNTTTPREGHLPMGKKEPIQKTVTSVARREDEKTVAEEQTDSVAKLPANDKEADLVHGNTMEDSDAMCFEKFARRVYSPLQSTQFHTAYYRVLEHFARGDIRRLIVSVPPQHGKSLGASILLPSYLLGLNPDCKIALASYNATLASRFNRRVQRILDSKAYSAIFPESAIKPLSGRSDAIRTANQFEVIGRRGELFSVGREGSLTGNEVDIFILDDLYKDAMEANSPVIRDNCWEWYTAVVRSRMHNDSQELIVFTRWHEEDLIGSILAKESHTILSSWSDIESLGSNEWLVINFEALKDSPPTEIDPRGAGEALWPARHSRELLLSKRNLDAFWFNCMYQGRPSMIEGLLYFDRFELYTELPTSPIKRANYTDTADMGDDYLCSVCYDVGSSGQIYITDVVYSRQPMEVTEGLVAQMLELNLTRHSYIESNNGGRGFARAVGKLVPHVRVEWFHQGQNKEARILTNSSTVLHSIRMPRRWAELWPEFYNHLVNYRRLYSSNRWHDAPDVLTGIVQREIVDVVAKRVVVY